MLLILIIDNNSKPIYNICREIWRSNAAKYPDDVKIYFLRSSESMCDDNITEQGDILHINMPLEDVNIANIEIIKKTLAATKFCLERWDFNFLIRTNLSSFYNIPNLIDLIENLPKKDIYAGFIGEYQDGDDLLEFCSGAGCIMSKDICKILIDRENTVLKMPYPDDIWIAKTLWDIPKTRLDRTDFTAYKKIDFELIKKLILLRNDPLFKCQYHFRVKNDSGKDRAQLDSLILYFLLSANQPTFQFYLQWAWNYFKSNRK